ncbi:SDR family NAD(P)-dependent oxidoreductase [Bacillaceae bacterium]
MRGKVVLITGGTRGIGQKIAECCAREGASVWVSSRSAEESLPAKAAPGEIRVIRLDVTDEASVRRTFQTIYSLHRRIDVLVNNAGVGIFKPVCDTSLAEWEEVLRTNLTGVFLCSREAFRYMKEQGGGRIINIASVAGYLPIAGSGGYGTSKYAVRGFSAILNEEGKPYNIRVSVVSPGMVYTEMTNGSFPFPREEMLEAEDVAQTIVDIARRPLRVRIDEVKILPPKGVL